MIKVKRRGSAPVPARQVCISTQLQAYGNEYTRMKQAKMPLTFFKIANYLLRAVHTEVYKEGKRR